MPKMEAPEQKSRREAYRRSQGLDVNKSFMEKVEERWNKLDKGTKTAIKVGTGVAAAGTVVALASKKREENPAPSTPYY